MYPFKGLGAYLGFWAGCSSNVGFCHVPNIDIGWDRVEGIPAAKLEQVLQKRDAKSGAFQALDHATTLLQAST